MRKAPQLADITHFHNLSYLPVGQKRNIFGLPRCAYTSLVMVACAWAKEGNSLASTDSISLSMSSNRMANDLQPSAATYVIGYKMSDTINGKGLQVEIYMGAGLKNPLHTWSWGLHLYHISPQSLTTKF